MPTKRAAEKDESPVSPPVEDAGVTKTPDPTPGDAPAQVDAEDSHADPPPGEGLTPEDEIREEHIRRKPGGTLAELQDAEAKEQEAARAATLRGLARQMQLTEDEVQRVKFDQAVLDAPPILGHKLASHDEHRLASDDTRSGVEKVRAAVLEAVYPVTVIREEFDAALEDEGLNDDNRMEARQMVRRNEIYIRGR